MSNVQHVKNARCALGPDSPQYGFIYEDLVVVDQMMLTMKRAHHKPEQVSVASTRRQL
jgi:hypothetical protein